MSGRLSEALGNGRVQLALATVCCVGVFGGAHLSRAGGASDGAALSQTRLNGAWELQSVGGDPVGPAVESGVVSQRIEFADGKIQGETHLLAASASATTAMPFPDLSVSRVVESDDGHEITVYWNGTCALLPNNRLDFHIGKAQYPLAAHFDPQTMGLEMEQDAILTYKGAAHYRMASLTHK